MIHYNVHVTQQHSLLAAGVASLTSLSTPVHDRLINAGTSVLVGLLTWLITQAIEHIRKKKL